MLYNGTEVIIMIREYFMELGSIVFLLLFGWVLYSDITDKSYGCLNKLIRFVLAFVFAALSALCLRYR